MRWKEEGENEIRPPTMSILWDLGFSSQLVFTLDELQQHPSPVLDITLTEPGTSGTRQGSVLSLSLILSLCFSFTLCLSLPEDEAIWCMFVEPGMLTGVGVGQASLCTRTQLTLYIALFWPQSLVDPPQQNILHLEHSSFTLVQTSCTAAEEWHHE